MPGGMPEIVSTYMPERISEYVPERMSEYIYIYIMYIYICIQFTLPDGMSETMSE